MIANNDEAKRSKIFDERHFPGLSGHINKKLYMLAG